MVNTYEFMRLRAKRAAYERKQMIAKQDLIDALIDDDDAEREMWDFFVVQSGYGITGDMVDGNVHTGM